MNIEIDQLIEVVLKECQSIFIELYTTAQESDMKFYGQPPESAIVRYHNKFNTKGFNMGDVLLAWKINKDNIKVINNLDIIPEEKPVDRMYFKEGNFLFSIDLEMKKVVLEWLVGPRIGRGYTYNINRIDNKLTIVRDKILWVS